MSNYRASRLPYKIVPVYGGRVRSYATLGAAKKALKENENLYKEVPGKGYVKVND